MTNQAMMTEAAKLFAQMDTKQQADFGKLLLGAKPFSVLPEGPFPEVVARSVLMCACEAVTKVEPA